MKCIGYIRVSSDKQGDGDGPDRQREAIAAYCARHGHKLDRTFDDIGGRGADLERPALGAALDYAKANGIDLLLVENADRWARDLLVGETLLLAWRAAGVKIVAVQGDTDLTNNDDPTAKMIRQVLGAGSEWAKSMLVSRMISGRKRVAAQRGYYASRKPSPRGKATAELIRLCRKGATYQDVAEQLNKKGLATACYGKPWIGETVRLEWARYATEDDKAERDTARLGV